MIDPLFNIKIDFKSNISRKFIVYKIKLSCNAHLLSNKINKCLKIKLGKYLLKNFLNMSTNNHFS